MFQSTVDSFHPFLRMEMQEKQEPTKDNSPTNSSKNMQNKTICKIVKPCKTSHVCFEVLNVIIGFSVFLYPNPPAVYLC